MLNSSVKQWLSHSPALSLVNFYFFLLILKEFATKQKECESS